MCLSARSVQFSRHIISIRILENDCCSFSGEMQSFKTDPALAKVLKTMTGEPRFSGDDLVLIECKDLTEGKSQQKDFKWVMKTKSKKGTAIPKDFRKLNAKKQREIIESVAKDCFDDKHPFVALFKVATEGSTRTLDVFMVVKPEDRVPSQEKARHMKDPMIDSLFPDPLPKPVLQQEYPAEAPFHKALDILLGEKPVVAKTQTEQEALAKRLSSLT